MPLAALETALLDTAVKLAAAGMSGVCIFMALWSGWMISRLSDNANREKHRTLRQFLWTCVLLALIAGASGVANAHYSRGKIELAEREAAVAKEETQRQERILADIRSQKLHYELKLAELSQAAKRQDFTQVSRLLNEPAPTTTTPSKPVLRPLNELLQEQSRPAGR